MIFSHSSRKLVCLLNRSAAVVAFYSTGNEARWRSITTLTARWSTSLRFYVTIILPTSYDGYSTLLPIRERSLSPVSRLRVSLIRSVELLHSTRSSISVYRGSGLHPKATGQEDELTILRSAGSSGRRS